MIDKAAKPDRQFTVQNTPEGHVISNGTRRVQLAPNGEFDGPDIPAPMTRTGASRWSLLNTTGRLAISTQIKTNDEQGIHWCTTYSTPNGDCLYTCDVQWQRGSDTLIVDEQIATDTDAVIQIRPLGDAPATAFAHGGGERLGPMQPLTAADDKGVLGRLGHLSYFNQWQLAWVGFTADGDDAPFAGIFTGWASGWHMRGSVRITAVRTAEYGDVLHLPIQQGRRRWGLVLSTRKDAAVDATDQRCLLNWRKATLADLPHTKTTQWVLDPPLPDRKLRLLPTDAMQTIRNRLADDQQIIDALEAHYVEAQPTDPGFFATAWWKSDQSKFEEAVAELVEWAERTEREVCDGGYERLIIFEGRHIKRRACDLDVMWAFELIDEKTYRKVRRVMLMLAYMFADPDYCRYADFWTDPDGEDDPSAAKAIAAEMGPTPVPPNFAAEFVSTVGVVAALFDEHPKSPHWRDWSIQHIDGYLNRFFEEDGTYRESVNYHNHVLNMLCCLMWPLREQGHHDYFEDPRIVGSFQHFVQVTTPPTDDVEQTGGALHRPWPPHIAKVLADPCTPRSAYINNGNSGGDWLMQSPRGELTIGIAAYRHSQPELAGQLAWVWQQSGKTILDSEHPILTLALLDPSVAPIEPPLQSVHRRSLGIVSRSPAHNGTFALFRAGAATNHMDFDQGTIQLIAYNKVLLRDPGYHAHADDVSIHAAATRWHSTIVYSDNLDHSSGYTGIEQAPEPVRVQLTDEYDWCAHRIVNTNHRDLSRLPYNVCLPCDKTTHWRQYLLAKRGGYILIHDIIEPADRPCVFLLQPQAPLQPSGPGSFTADAGDDVYLDVQFLHPAKTTVDDAPHGTFAARNESGRFLTVLAPRKADQHTDATAIDSHTIRVDHPLGTDHIQLPDQHDGEVGLRSSKE